MPLQSSKAWAPMLETILPPSFEGIVTAPVGFGETAAKYYNAADADGIVFFEEVAEWGDDYTGILSLRTSDGAYFAELCVDVPVQEIHSTIRSHLLLNLATIVALGVLFLLGFVFWSNRNIVEEVVDAERVASEMRELALKDPLTGVRNKGAFAACLQELQERVDNGESIGLAFGVFDCDDLKGINDLYGHDRGDEYLKGASAMISRVFEHSPVFRIGGDEFAVILEGEDFENREALAERFEAECRKTLTSAENEWQQVRVTQGIAAFDPGVDRTVSDAARRADRIMYG